MRITIKPLAIALFFSATIVAAQGKTPRPPAQPRFKTEPAAPRNDLAFAAIKASSTRFSDQVEPDTAISADEVFATCGTTLFIPDARTQDVAWEKAVQSTTTALGRIGLVPTGKADVNRFPSDLAVEIKSLRLSKRFILVFHPKDQESFAALVKGVELLGDREIGGIDYNLRGYALVLDGRFNFTDKGCQVSMNIGNKVYGNLISEEKVSSGPGDSIPTEWMDTHKLTANIKSTLPR